MVLKFKAPPTWYNYTYAYPDGYIEDGIDLTDIVFYVGKGTKGRIDQHEKEAQKGCDCQKCQVIRRIWEKGFPVKKRIVFETLVESDALTREMELIAKHSGKHLTNIIGIRTRFPNIIQKKQNTSLKQNAPLLTSIVKLNSGSLINAPRYLEGLEASYGISIPPPYTAIKRHEILKLLSIKPIDGKLTRAETICILTWRLREEKNINREYRVKDLMRHVQQGRLKAYARYNKENSHKTLYTVKEIFDLPIA